VWLGETPTLNIGADYFERDFDDTDIINFYKKLGTGAPEKIASVKRAAVVRKIQ
jgi:hypothetical protein